VASAEAAVDRGAAELDAALLDGIELDGIELGGIELAGVDDVVVVAPSELPSIPWQLLPRLRGRSVVVAPAAGLIGRTPAPKRSGVALIAGPGLPGAVDEINRLNRLHSGATVLSTDQASSAAVRQAFGGRAVVHVAAHARLEQSQPLLSSLELADGPLYVHDLLGLDDPPAVAIFSACQSAQGSDAFGGEVLGLASALITRGADAVVGCVVPLPDSEPTREAMERVHARLLDGQSVSGAIASVAAGDDPPARIAQSLITIGT
jgi:hypothetical protein